MAGMDISHSKLFLPIVITVLVSTLAISVPEAEAINGFQGPYDPSNWTFSSAGNGFVGTGGAPTFITLTGVDGPRCISCATDFTITIPASGTLSFDWNYQSFDISLPLFDPAQFVINGVTTQLTSNFGSKIQSGSVSIQVLAGDTFTFRILSTDGIFGPGAFTSISNFVGPGGSTGGGPAEPPTIGMNMAGTNLIVTCGVAFDGNCFTITALFHEEFKLYEMMSGTHTISITMYCVDGVNTCNYAAIGIMPYSESMDNTTWKIELYKDFEGNIRPVTTDPEGFLGDVTVTTQILDDKFWLVSFTADFKNKDTGPMKFGVQARNDINAVRNWYLNEGVEFKDSDAYPSIVTEFEDSLEIDSLCLNEDPTYRYSCGFAEIRERATQLAEETLWQMLNDEYTYK